MRPKDENQHGSMRPNLMSPSARRASSEENILAMLERDSAERGSSTRMAWYGAGSALALVLVGALGWLAWDNGLLHDDQLLTPVAVAAPAPAPIVASAASPHAPAIQPARAATIVEASPEPERLAQADAAQPPEPAPLVLLSPAEAAERQRAAAHHVAEPRLRKPEPRRAAAQAKPSRKRLAAKPAARARAHVRPSRHALRPASPRAGKAPKAADARLKKTAPAAAVSAETPPDSDVALISAILSRPAAHAAGRPSGPRLAPQP